MEKMHWELIDIFFILWCLVASAAAECPPESCGTMKVSYPFWIHNPDCGYPGFRINCRANVNNGEYTPFLPTSDGYFEIWDINYSGYIIIESTSLKASYISPSCNRIGDPSVVFSLPQDGPFTISSLNRLAAIGCRANGSFTDNSSEMSIGRCESGCEINQFVLKYCNSYPCCEVSLPGNTQFINFSGGGDCGFSTVLDPSTFRPPVNVTGFFLGGGRYGMRLEWRIGDENCPATNGTSNYSCAKLAHCTDSTTWKGHVCTCPDGYEGNGYSNGTGCVDINECLDVNKNECVEEKRGGQCENLSGTYTCSCKKGYNGNGFRNDTGCESSNNVIVPAIIGSVFSFVGVSLASCALFWCLRRRHMKYVRIKYFQQNGGIHLQQYIASRRGRATLKIYSAIELEKASRNYSTDMKLGSGGYGTVFKAILPDNIIGAIKKSKEIFDPQQQDDQFINELIILSQINHRNVVKLLGCCLETQNPLLVYEFVPNGTLREHIDSNDYLSWEIRLRIAIETAEALAYLHSAASQPIFHRDIKSSNILLDNTYTPKVADFGISRLLDAGDTHLTTNVAGTIGYMDPEYFQSFQLTDKSDVYSFGVVLLELVTGLGPLSLERRRDECALSGFFLSRWNNNCLHEILDARIMNGENRMQIKNMAHLARECLHVEGRRRPSMKEVVDELLWIRGATRRRKPYVGDERCEGNDENENEMHMQRGTSDAVEIKMKDPLFRGEGFGARTSEGSSTALIQSFNIGGR